MLSEIIRQNSTPLDPIPTEVEPVLGSLEEIRAVVFDIYGTLVISAAGDISLVQENASERAMAAAGIDDPVPAAVRYQELIAEHQSRSDHEFPEVEIRDVWRDLTGKTDPDEIERIAVTYEAHANPVWTMPNCAEVVQAVHNRGIKLGIVSNAQFYTRHLFPALLDSDLETLGFDPDLMVFSYEEGIGKPSRELYQKLANNLASQGVAPHETLYVGNDVRKDILPAGQEGFQTALFAGDKRSLRLHPELNAKPDWIITDLAQLCASTTQPC